MGLVVLAQVIRELIADGEYLVECIQHREHGKVAVAFTLRSRAQPHSIQIETTDNKLGGLFRALLHEDPARTGKPAVAKVGTQAVPIVEVDSLPNRHRKRVANCGKSCAGNDDDVSGPRAPIGPRNTSGTKS